VSASKAQDVNNITLEGKIDMQRIKDIRQALRRKYASRSNAPKVFSQWDKSNTGDVNAEDIYMSLNKLGIVASKDEARVLLASATEDQSRGNLNADEFEKLVFSAHDDMKVVDLSAMVPSSNRSQRNTFAQNRNSSYTKNMHDMGTDQ